MDLRCFVRVLPESGDVPGGTGYLISRDRVLTAAHVVGGAARVSIEHDDAEGKDVVRLEATVHWRGDEDCDVALLLLPETAAIEVAPPRLADQPLTETTDWESRGWPRISEDEIFVRDSMTDLHGEASPFHAAQKRFQLTVGVQLRDNEQWRGASGAPVFEKGTNRILGVVAEVLRAAENAWHASPLTAAFLREGFLEKLGAEIVRERRDQLIAKVTEILGKSGELVQELASCHEGWRSRDRAGLADAILSTDVVEVLNRLNQLHTRLWRTKRTVVREIEEIVAWIAPVLVQSRVLHALPNETGGVWLCLPVETVTVAELAIAGFDGRPSVLKSKADDFPDGVGQLPLPPEAGFDFNGKASLQDYAAHFEKEILKSEDRKLVRRERDRKGEEKALDLALRLVDGELQFEADFGEPPLRRYLLYDDEFARDRKALLAQLRRRLKSIHLVEMAGGDLLAERCIGRPLREILARSAKPPEITPGGVPTP